MIYKPHSYQEYSQEFIINNSHSALFLECGLGKTVVALTAIQSLMHDYFEIIKVLVIAPLRVAEDTWSSETEKWDHLKYLKISKVLGSEKERVIALNTTTDIEELWMKM